MDAKETSIYLSIIITSVVLGIIIVYFLVSIIRHQRKILALHKKSIQAEVAAQDQERARIASDLHDEIGPMISTIKLRINNFELTDPGDEEDRMKTNGTIDSIAQRIREISFNLMPASLLRKGITSALEQFIGNLEKGPIKIHWVTNLQNLQLSEYTSISIYRIVQELIQNTIKHAQATHLQIEWKMEENKYMLITKDDGVGFDHSRELKENIGFGLRNLMNRVEMINGELFIESAKSKGTSYRIEIPREQNQDLGGL